MTDAPGPPPHRRRRPGAWAAAAVAVIGLIAVAALQTARPPAEEPAPGPAAGSPPAPAGANSPAAAAANRPSPGGDAGTAPGNRPAPRGNVPPPADRPPAPPPSPADLPPDHPPISAGEEAQVTLQWFGASCVYVHSPGGVAAVLDPFDDAEAGLPEPGTGAHLAVFSRRDPLHGHREGVRPFEGQALRAVFGEEVRQGDLVLRPVDLGAGRAFAYRIEAAGLRIAHLGGLSGPLPESAAARIGEVDVLLLPVGGRGLTPGQAVAVCERLKPRVVLPLDFAAPGMPDSAGPLRKVDDFVAASPYARTDLGADVILLSRGQLPPSPEIWVFRYRQ